MDNMNRGEVSYLGLREDVQRFCKQKVDYRSFVVSQDEGYKSIARFIEGWQIKYPLDGIVGEIDKKLSSWNVVEPAANLLGELNNMKACVAKLEESVQELEKVHEGLKSLGDRHGKVEAERNYKTFMDSLRNMRYSAIGNAIDVTIPGLINDIKRVIGAFDSEDKMHGDNRKFAASLRKRLETYKDYVDKHDNKRICDNGFKVVNSVLNNPSINPDEDKRKLDNLELELDKVKKAFAKEKAEIEEFESKIYDSGSIWKEDYERIIKKTGEDPCYTTDTLEDYERMYSNACSRKQSDILSFEGKYNEKILDEFYSDMNTIRNKCVYSNELNKLEEKIKEFQKERLKKILKIVGIALACIAVIIIVVLIVKFIANNPWVLIIAAIIAGLVIYFKNS